MNFKFGDKLYSLATTYYFLSVESYKVSINLCILASFVEHYDVLGPPGSRMLPELCMVD